MVITNLLGGLGNQLFQYAVGRALSLQHDVQLKFDVSGFAEFGGGYSLWEFEFLRVFDCPVQLASDTDIAQILGWQSNSRINRLLMRPGMDLFRRKGFIVEPYFHYWQGINQLPSHVLLKGFWQSEKYFINVAKQIRDDLRFKHPLVDLNAEIAKQISQVNAVSLHVRRGDYASNAKTTATHGLCSLDYYRAAIRHVVGQVEHPHFFIFSDDPAWVKSNLKIDYPCEFVEHNQGKESYNDMRLMSLCQHHIIANSSFSWWGAWLNPSVKKIVVAPKQWFANDNDTQDLIPQGWVRL